MEIFLKLYKWCFFLSKTVILVCIKYVMCNLLCWNLKEMETPAEKSPLLWRIVEIISQCFISNYHDSTCRSNSVL